MPAVLHYSTFNPVKPKPVRVRPKNSIDDLLKRAVASVDKGEVKLISGRFRLQKRERPLTWRVQALLLFFASALGLAIWMQARPEPISAYARYYQSRALSLGPDSPSARAFAESALLAIGREGRSATLFAYAHPLFWMRTPAVHPDALTNRIEAGLARLASHGKAVSVLVFNTPSLVTLKTADGTVALTCLVTGQVEFSDGIVLRFWARLIQDNKSKQWGILDLSIPPFLS